MVGNKVDDTSAQGSPPVLAVAKLEEEDEGEDEKSDQDSEASNHSIPRPSDLAHMTIKDLDTNEQVHS